jgi:hypothetical protein
MSWDRWQKTGRGDAIKSEFVTGLVSELKHMLASRLDD